jgi:hypothetical protein
MDTVEQRGARPVDRAARARSSLRYLRALQRSLIPGGAFGASVNGRAADRQSQQAAFAPFLDDLEARTFRFFCGRPRDPKNGLVPERYPTPSYASIAAVGFGLTAYPIGADRGYIPRAAAGERVLATLRFFARAANQHGFFYHFLDMNTGERANDSEVSTVDTALLLAGV